MSSVEHKRESSLSPSSSSTRQPKYDVFLSFRGEDTRNNFTDHLYVVLNQKGIITFRDEEGLERGESIAPKLFKAIEESQFAIIILSKNYASSTWCLDELTKIIKCKDEMGLKVLPVFYNVSPSVVRKQTETFEQAFIDHQKRFEDNIKKVETWRDTLKKVADISGWDLHLQNRHESEIIQDIVKGIMEKLSSKSSSINENLIGINSMVAKLIPSYVGFGNDTYMMGICGMGGLGKTTLASAIYYKYSDHFEGSSFIANVRERSEKGELHKLQQQLLGQILERSNIKIYNVQDGVKKIKSSGLCHKKVLLVLDDVNHKDQLENLAEKRDWFGSGSWIIITTRDEHVLVQHGVLKIYKPNVLDDDDALTLFCSKAFKKEQPEEGYMQLSRKVVKYASGLPFALVTLGSFLVGRTVEEWQSALNSFKNIKGNIHDILKISYDGLEKMWKEIFLDIACFFRWQKKDDVIQILEICGFNARIGVSVLVERSLLTVDDKECFVMHDLLAEMGQKIIRFESGGKLGKQSRLWLVEDLLHVLKNDMATEAIQAIVVRFKENEFNYEAVPEVILSKMSNLRLMMIKKTDYYWYDRRYLDVPNDQRQILVPNQLRYLSWDRCPLKCLSSSSQPKELVGLGLYESRIEYLWEGVMRSVNLKFINLCRSKNLIRTPDFSGVPMLEGLSFSHCDSLVEIHPSIGQLSKLKYLNLLCCKSLTDLPCMSAVMQSLTDLDLTFCSKISSFPKFTGIMKSLSKLKLCWTAIKKVPPSLIKYLTALTFLDLSFCTNLECLPSNMDNLRSLQTLHLTICKKLKSLPRLPSTIRCIHVELCGSLKWLPAWVKLSIWSQPLSQWLPYDERHSQKEFTILVHFLQGLLCRTTVYGNSSKSEEDGFGTEFQIIIPSCLTQKVGNSISIELPSNWYNSKWIGLALWALLPNPRLIDGLRAREVVVGKMHQNNCAFELLTTRINVEVQTDYLLNYVLYVSRDEWFAVGNGECSQIEVIFNGSKLFDLKIGVSLVYEKDADEFNQTNEQCLIESFGEVHIFKSTVGDDDGDDDDDDDDEDDNWR
ncbi:TMV resistance protein N-like [Castanea sativa]|uniref:TMV resistance protein N-like n=1 Tax=Castanea sativa TaxID=21020 RepID=UPI003F649968